MGTAMQCNDEGEKDGQEIRWTNQSAGKGRESTEMITNEVEPSIS